MEIALNESMIDAVTESVIKNAGKYLKKKSYVEISTIIVNLQLNLPTLTFW